MILGHSRGNTEQEALLSDIKELIRIILVKGVGFGAHAGENPPLPNEGNDGDVYFQTNNTVYIRENGVWINKEYFWSSLFDVRNGLNVNSGRGELGGNLIRNTTVDAANFLFNLLSVNRLTFNLNPSTIHTEGQLYWNPNDKTFNIDTEIPANSIKIGQKEVVRVLNNTGSTVSSGSVVYVNGVQSNKPTIALANSNIQLITKNTVGIVTYDITDNSIGYITVFGLLRNIDTSAFNDGDVIYISQTSGQITNIEPSSTYIIQLGFVLLSDISGALLIDVKNITPIVGDIDGGFANSVYLSTQLIDGGTA